MLFGKVGCMCSQDVEFGSRLENLDVAPQCPMRIHPLVVGFELLCFLIKIEKNKTKTSKRSNSLEVSARSSAICVSLRMATAECA